MANRMPPELAGYWDDIRRELWAVTEQRDKLLGNVERLTRERDLLKGSVEMLAQELQRAARERNAADLEGRDG